MALKVEGWLLILRDIGHYSALLFCCWWHVSTNTRKGKCLLYFAPYGLMNTSERNSHDSTMILHFVSCRTQWVIITWATGREDSTSASDQVICYDWKQWLMKRGPCGKVSFNICLWQEHTAGLSFWGREVSFGRPGPRLWSLTSGHVKSGRGDMGHGGGFSWATLNCELLHLQAVVFANECIYSYYTRGQLPFPQMSPCEMYQPILRV